MKLHRLAGMVAGLLTFLALAASPALADKTYTIRIEGQTQTLLAKQTVTVPDGGSIPGADASCGYNEPAGPLAIATGGNWDGAKSPPSSFAGLVETILGESHTASTSTFWALWVNGTWGGGICFQSIQPGDDVLIVGGGYDSNFNAVDLPLVIGDAPTHVNTGQPFTVTVREPHPDLGSFSDFQSGTGTLQPAVGVTVSIGGVSATTGADGKATLIAAQAGALQLQATRGNAPSRSQLYQVCASDGNDGTCGTTKPIVIDRTGPISSLGSLAGIASYAKGKGPRELKGNVSDPSGLLMVKLRITRTSGGHCSYFSGKRLTFRAMRCGAANGSWFKVGANGAWSYLLPKRLSPGRYVVDVNAIDKAYNRDDARRRGSNRVVFIVR
jgi:hypothetical protein